MTPAVAIALVLLSAALHASWNALLGASNERERQLALMAIPYSVFGLAGAAWAPLPSPPSWPYIVLSAVCELVYCGALLRAYARADFVRIYTVARGSSPLFIALGAAAFAGEAPRPLQVAGIACVSTGVVCLSLGHSLSSALSMRLALATGAAVACYTLLDGIGVRTSGSLVGYLSWVYLLWNGCILVVFSRKGLTSRGALFRSATGTARGIAAGVASLLAYGSVIAAMENLPMGVVSALRETGIVFAVAIGWTLLRIPPSVASGAGCLLVCAGAVLLTWGI